MSGVRTDGVEPLVGDRYRIIRELGRGGMGVVYLGHDERRDMDLAIKVCGKKHAGATLWLKREFRVVASLRHPNLVELFELVAHERTVYFTMEYVSGVDPRTWTWRPRPQPKATDEDTDTLAPLRALHATRSVPDVDFARVRSVLGQLAEALAFLHARGVIHRDVKPSNVLVANGAAKLLDFGLALERRRVDEEVARETRIVGTAAYLAPEYVDRLAVTPAMDVYALGVLAFELATGAPPFAGADVVSGERKSLVLPRASRINAAVPRDLEELIDEMLAANPARRPSALQVAARIAGGSSQPRPMRRAEHFVGRTVELGRLARVLADPAPGARFVVVTGPSGGGKTALVEEALNQARVAGDLPPLVWRGRCHERELVPYRAFDFVIDDLAAELARDRQLGATLEHAGALGRAFPTLGAALGNAAPLAPAASDLRVERERALVAMAQLFDRVIGAQRRTRDDDGDDGDDDRAQRRRARGLVVIDDLQWADDDSLELLAAIVARATRPLAIVATFSTHTDEPARTSSPSISLRALEDAATARGAIRPGDDAAATRAAPPGDATMRVAPPAGDAAAAPPGDATMRVAPPAGDAAAATRAATPGDATTRVAPPAGDALPPQLAPLFERLGEAASHLALAPMDPEELVELIAEVAPRAPALHLRAAVAVAAGSPYLAELIARELAETGEVDPRNSELRRLARLAPAERAIAELTALATSGTSFEQLVRLAQLPSTQLVSVLRALEDARIIKVSPSASGEPLYGIYHQRLRDATSAALAPAARRALHLRFAQLGEREAPNAPPEQLAHHYEHGGERDRAAHWAIVAADAARAQLAWGVAADWYERALALGTPCRQQLAECLFLGGKLAEAARAFEELARLASDPTEPAFESAAATADEITGDFPAGASAADAADRWRVRAAEAYLKLGELERGLAILDGVLARRGEPRAGSRLGSAARAALVAARWLTVSALPRPVADGLRRLRGRPARVRPSGARTDDVLAATYRVIASFLSTPYPIEAFEYVLREIASAEEAGDRGAHGLGMAMLSVYLGVGSLGRFGDRALATARRLSEASGAPYPRMVAAGAGGILATLRGDWAGMRASHGEGKRICTTMGLERSWEASFLRSYEAIGEHCAGEPGRTLAILDELVDSSEDLIVRALLGNYRARALLLAGDLDGAHRVAESLARAHAVGAHGLAGVYRKLVAGELALAHGRWARAAELGLELERWARDQWLSAMPAISAMIDQLVATAELGSGDRAAAARARARARALYRRGRVSFYAVTALRLWGQAELRLGDEAAAERLLARAAAAAERAGKVDRLAIARLRGGPATGELAFAVRWSTAGMVP